MLTLSRWRPLSYGNQSIDLQTKSMDWFLYNRDLDHERVKNNISPRFVSKKDYSVLSKYYWQPIFTCSKLTMEAPEHCVKSVQS